MIARVIFAALLLSFTANAATDLGKNLPFKTKTNGDPSFGVSYTYDPDGTSYLLTFTPQVSPSEGVRQLRWNYYLRSTDSFLLDWAKDRMASLAVFQVKLADEKLSATIEKMIKAQKSEKDDKDGELFFVLADENNKPVYFVSLSDLCSKYPSNFNDLSFSRRCDDPKL